MTILIWTYEGKVKGNK